MSAHATTTNPLLSASEQVRRDVLTERYAMLRWTGIILFLLFGSISMWIYAAVLAVSDPSMAVVPDYHEKALQWDKQAAINAASRELGWTVHSIVGARNATSNHRTLTLFIRDSDAQPITGAHGTLRLYHHARAALAETVELRETSPGAYDAEVTLNREGTWELELKLERGDTHFEWIDTRDFEGLK